MKGCVIPFGRRVQISAHFYSEEVSRIKGLVTCQTKNSELSKLTKLLSEQRKAN
jgi:hypothetical protein